MNHGNSSCLNKLTEINLQMLSFRHPLIFIFRIANHQRTYNFMFRRHGNQIQQRLIACNTAGLDKAGDSCSQTDGRGKQLCIGPTLLCIAHTGNIQTACQRKNQTGRIAGDNILSTLTVSAQYHLKITFILVPAATSFSIQLATVSAIARICSLSRITI